MSLEQAAKHLAAHGRGPDTELVHMTKGEINSLQTLAKANGGSLTINPHTGLPEAGFLSNILPVVAGAAAMYFTGGTAGPLVAGLTNAQAIGLGMGALQTARTGSLQKGLMAGLGAYGGAGLAGGLMGAGASQVAPTAQALGVEGASTGAGSQAAMLAKENAAFGQAGLESLGQSAAVAPGATPVVQTAGQSMLAGTEALGSKAGWNSLAQQVGGNKALMGMGLAAAAPMMAGTTTPQPQVQVQSDSKMPQRLQYNVGRPVDAQGQTVTPQPDVPGYGDLGRDFGREQNYFPNAGYQNITDEEAKARRGYAMGGTIEQMSTANAVGANTGYPMADIQQGAYATPYQTPVSQNVVAGAQDVAVDPYTGQEQRTVPAPVSRLARGGLSAAASHLGDYSDGGRLLKGPGDGVSDSIPATIGNKRPARLADGEFVVPARIVSELGNGSTEAGARKLYAMLDRVQAARKKSIGKGKVAKNSRADKFLPA